MRNPRNVIYASLKKVINYSKTNEYKGYCKFDALNSPIIYRFSRNNKLLKLKAIQVVSHMPFNIRPLLGVPKGRNPKGIGNFIRAYAYLFMVEPKDYYLSEIKKLSDWLLANRFTPNTMFQGMCWGYNYPWESAHFSASYGFPNCIVTVFVAEALLDAYLITRKEKYLVGAESAANFLLNDLPVLEEKKESKCIGYVPAHVKSKVININAVTAGFLSRLSVTISKPSLLDAAIKLCNYVASTQTADHAWYYTDPELHPDQGYDNYHTGGILDGLFEVINTSGDAYLREIYLKGLKFYKNTHFDMDGAPKYTSTSRYPYDAHAAAQGILTFIKAATHQPAYYRQAEKIALWTINHLQHFKKGYFMYQIHPFPFLNHRYPLMRWTNSWMSMALAAVVNFSGTMDITGEQG
nr:hypothetical protein [Bacteroidota bacterium]